MAHMVPGTSGAEPAKAVVSLAYVYASNVYLTFAALPASAPGIDTSNVTFETQSYSRAPQQCRSLLFIMTAIFQPI